MPDNHLFDHIRISVIIVNWNAGIYLKECILSLRKQIRPPYEVLIVDNASTDGSDEGLEDCYPQAKVIRLKKNIGFAAANNYAARLVSDECNWIALLNPDAMAAPSWLEALTNAARHHPGYAFFGSRLMKAGKPSQYDGIGDICHISGLAWREGHGKTADDSGLRAKEIFSPCAAAAMYRKDCFVEAKGFDEDFFCYAEDVDLGYRLRLLGYRCLYVPEAVAYHVGSASTGDKHSDFAVYHGHRNLVWAFIKNTPGMLFWVLLPVHLMHNFVVAVYFGMMGQGKTILRSKRDAAYGIHRMWKKRRQVQESRRTSVMDIWRMLDKTGLLLRR
jgi:GT2 family glycosyltransferase